MHTPTVPQNRAVFWCIQLNSLFLPTALENVTRAPELPGKFRFLGRREMPLQASAVCPLTPRPLLNSQLPPQGRHPEILSCPRRNHPAWDGGMELKNPKVDCPTSTHIQHSLDPIPSQARQPHLPGSLGKMPQEAVCPLPAGIPSKLLQSKSGTCLKSETN